MAQYNSQCTYRFTFHYASTISTTALPRVSTHPIYIPLCFYYIIFLFWQLDIMSGYLHSTMLLLYHVLSGWRFRLIFIYIPLCFYYIRKLLKYSISSRSYLHSTMLLLYRIGVTVRDSPDSNLHSTMLLLYLVSITRERSMLLFTFHYASTISGSVPRVSEKL